MGIATFKKHRIALRIAREMPAPDRLTELKARHGRLRDELADVGRQISELTAADKKNASPDAAPPVQTAGAAPKVAAARR